MLKDLKPCVSKIIIGGNKVMAYKNRFSSDKLEKIIHPNIEGRVYSRNATEKYYHILGYILEDYNLIENLTTNPKNNNYIVTSKMADEINKKYKIKSGDKDVVTNKTINNFLKTMESDLGFMKKILWYQSLIGIDGNKTRVYTYNILFTPKFYDYIINIGLDKRMKVNVPSNYRTYYDDIMDYLTNSREINYTEIESNIKVEATAKKKTSYNKKGNNKGTIKSSYDVDNITEKSEQIKTNKRNIKVIKKEEKPKDDSRMISYRGKMYTSEEYRLLLKNKHNVNKKKGLLSDGDLKRSEL